MRTALLVLCVCCSPSPHGAPSHAHWGYDESSGPTRWASLDPSFARCASGNEQSPIDLPDKPDPGDPHLLPQLHPSSLDLKLVDNGHTIQVTGSHDSTATCLETQFELAQFHFHVPSEHTIAGKSFDAEIHMVHKSAKGQLLVVGLLLSKGEKNAALDPVFQALPLHVSEVPGAKIDLGALVGQRPRFFHYDGSLTTPPCTEGVEWYVIDPATSPLTISDDQLAKLGSAVHGDNHRPTQPGHERRVVSVGP
jgi:carbonic anhydrase